VGWPFTNRVAAITVTTSIIALEGFLIDMEFSLVSIGGWRYLLQPSLRAVNGCGFTPTFNTLLK
jgi:hypothetical protein